jgi:hypothetical protein
MGSSRSTDRNCEFLIEAFVRANTGYDNTIEAAMATDSTRGGNAKDSVLTRSEFEFSDEGDKPMAMARLTYSVRYRTLINDATSAT